MLRQIIGRRAKMVKYHKIAETYNINTNTWRIKEYYEDKVYCEFQAPSVKKGGLDRAIKLLELYNSEGIK